MPALEPEIEDPRASPDPFEELPDDEAPSRLSRRDRLLVAGLWSGAAALIASGGAVQVREHRIAKQQCFGTSFDFACTRTNPVLRWGQLGALALWGSSAALVAGGASRFRGRHGGDRAGRGQRARIGVGAALLVVGGAGVVAASLVPARSARRCQDAACLSRATAVRIVGTDVAMLGVIVGGGLLASATRPRSRVSATLGPRMVGVAVTRAF